MKHLELLICKHHCLVLGAIVKPDFINIENRSSDLFPALQLTLKVLLFRVRVDALHCEGIRLSLWTHLQLMGLRQCKGDIVER